MEYILWVWFFALGWVVGRAIQRFMMVRVMLNSLPPDARLRILQRNTPELIPMLYTEIADGTIFVYDELTHRFMCSGADIASLAIKVNGQCKILSHMSGMMI